MLGEKEKDCTAECGIGGGMVTLKTFVKMPDGKNYGSIWCRYWEYFPSEIDSKELALLKPLCDALILQAAVNYELRMMIPLNSVRGWVKCDEPPKSDSVYIIK